MVSCGKPLLLLSLTPSVRRGRIPRCKPSSARLSAESWQLWVVRARVTRWLSALCAGIQHPCDLVPSEEVQCLASWPWNLLSRSGAVNLVRGQLVVIPFAG